MKKIGLLLISVSLYLGAAAQDTIPEATTDSSAVEEKDKGKKSLSLLKKANVLLLEEKYGEASPLLEQAIEIDESNFNAKFKLGLCMLKSLDKRSLAFKPLKEATKKMTSKYSYQDYQLKEAPYNALYLLGKAFLEVSQPDSAMEAFRSYGSKYTGDPPFSSEDQVMMCYNAKASVKNPRDVSVKNMGRALNSVTSESNPVVTMDNSVVFFSSRRTKIDNEEKDSVDARTGSLYEDIYISLADGKDGWKEPALYQHNINGNNAPLYIAPDGLTLYLRRASKTNIDIFSSVFKDGVWEKPKSLKAINSPFDETSMSISGDGNTLYFASNRDEGLGKSDIYKCEKKASGSWGVPENLGEVINTGYNEISPFIHPDGKTLFYSTNGNTIRGSGGYDIFYSELADDGTWSDPQSLGYPINSTRDEFNYYITTGGTRYFSRMQKNTSFDLFKVVGGGFDVESIDMGVEVVRLTQEMSVTEVLEVVEETEVEVEVIETIETIVEVEKEIEVMDMESMDEIDDEPLDDLFTDSFEEEVPEEEVEEISVFDTLNVENMDSTERAMMLKKVEEYMAMLEANKPKPVEKPEEVEEVEEEVEIQVDVNTVLFGYGSYQLMRFTKEQEKSLLEFVKKSPNKKIDVVGHTDGNGEYNYNLGLSNMRAKSVYDFLIKHGVKKENMVYYGKGSSDPAADNTTKVGRTQNRRVEVLVKSK